MSARPPLALLLILPTPAWAQAAPAAQDVGDSLSQLLGGLILVLALLFASLWLLKRLASPRGEAAGLLRVVAGTAVGPRERVVVLEVGDTWLVLGVAPGRVTALSEMPKNSLPPPSQVVGSNDFAGRLRQMLDRRHGG